MKKPRLRTRLVSIIVCAAITIPSFTPIRAADCDTTLKACDAALDQALHEIATLKQARQIDQEYSDILRLQRDAAVKELSERPPSMPWYFWVLMGAAGATIAIRGFQN